MLASWHNKALVCDSCLAICFSEYIEPDDDQLLLSFIEVGSDSHFQA